MISLFGDYLLTLNPNYKNSPMSIKYEIHSTKNSKGTGEDQEFVWIVECPPQTDTLNGYWNIEERRVR